MLFMYSQTFFYEILCDSPILQLGAGSPTNLCRATKGVHTDSHGKKEEDLPRIG